MHKTILEKCTLPLHGRLWMQLNSGIDSIRHSPEFQKKLLDGHDNKKCQVFRIPTFCLFCTARHYENIKNPSLGLETESRLQL